MPLTDPNSHLSSRGRAGQWNSRVSVSPGHQDLGLHCTPLSSHLDFSFLIFKVRGSCCCCSSCATVWDREGGGFLVHSWVTPGITLRVRQQEQR